jgi:hypothetical protein
MTDPITHDTIAALALALPGTVESAHFGKRDFRAPSIFLTLPAEDEANLAFTPDQQAMFMALHPDAFSVVPNAWGARGWTTMHLERCPEEAARAAVEAAWRTVSGKRRRGSRGKRET